MTALSIQQSFRSLPEPDLNQARHSSMLQLRLTHNRSTTPCEIIQRSLRSQAVMWIRLLQQFMEALSQTKTRTYHRLMHILHFDAWQRHRRYWMGRGNFLYWISVLLHRYRLPRLNPIQSHQVNPKGLIHGFLP